MVVCGICLSEDIKEIGELENCDHSFCFDCIVRWSTVVNLCPFCKVRFRTIRRKELDLERLPDSDAEDVAERYPGRVLETLPVADKEQEHVHEDDGADPMDHVVCLECGNGDDEEEMLLCDECDRGYHTYCMGLDEVPEGSWFCPACRPASDSLGSTLAQSNTSPARLRRRVRRVSDVSDALPASPPPSRRVTSVTTPPSGGTVRRRVGRRLMRLRPGRGRRRAEAPDLGHMLEVLEEGERRRSAGAADSHAHRRVDEMRRAWEQLRRQTADFGDAAPTSPAARPARGGLLASARAAVAGLRTGESGASRAAVTEVTDHLELSPEGSGGRAGTRGAAARAAALEAPDPDLEGLGGAVPQPLWADFRAELRAAKERGQQLGPSGRLRPVSSAHRPDLPQQPARSVHLQAANRAGPRTFRRPTAAATHPHPPRPPPSIPDTSSAQPRPRSPGPWSPPVRRARSPDARPPPVRRARSPNARPPQRRQVSESYARSFGRSPPRAAAAAGVPPPQIASLANSRNSSPRRIGSPRLSRDYNPRVIDAEWNTLPQNRSPRVSREASPRRNGSSRVFGDPIPGMYPGGPRVMHESVTHVPEMAKLAKPQWGPGPSHGDPPQAQHAFGGVPPAYVMHAGQSQQGYRPPTAHVPPGAAVVPPSHCQGQARAHGVGSSVPHDLPALKPPFGVPPVVPPHMHYTPGGAHAPGALVLPALPPASHHAPERASRAVQAPAAAVPRAVPPWHVGPHLSGRHPAPDQATLAGFAPDGGRVCDPGSDSGHSSSSQLGAAGLKRQRQNAELAEPSQKRQRHNAELAEPSQKRQWQSAELPEPALKRLSQKAELAGPSLKRQRGDVEPAGMSTLGTGGSGTCMEASWQGEGRSTGATIGGGPSGSHLEAAGIDRHRFTGSRAEAGTGGSGTAEPGRTQEESAAVNRHRKWGSSAEPGRDAASPNLSHDDQRKRERLREAKLAAAAEVKALLKPLLASGAIDRETFKAAAQAATGVIYPKLDWGADVAKEAVRKALRRLGVKVHGSDLG